MREFILTGLVNNPQKPQKHIPAKKFSCLDDKFAILTADVYAQYLFRSPTLACAAITELTYKHGGVSFDIIPGALEERHTAHDVKPHLIKEICNLKENQNC